MSTAEFSSPYVTTLELVPALAEETGEVDLSTQPAIGWFRYGPITGRLKRLIDVIVSAILLVVLSPIFLIIAVAIRRTSAGPALFRQTRVGFAEEPFTILKFRTMYVDNDESVHREAVISMLRDQSRTDAETDESGLYKMVDDPRITPVGRWLRRTSLDELPQLINVLRGEMSLVGPRPSLFYELDQYEPRHRLRAACMPGMTGLWQVEGRNSVHMLDALDLDIEYLKTCSLSNDLKILAKTVTVFTDDRAA